MMSLWDMQQEIRKANETLRNADRVAGDIAYILSGRLRHVPPYVLSQLKKELKDFNAHTGKWNKK